MADEQRVPPKAAANALVSALQHRRRMLRAGMAEAAALRGQLEELVKMELVDEQEIADLERSLTALDIPIPPQLPDP